MKRRIQKKIARRWASHTTKHRPKYRVGTLIRSGVQKPEPNLPSISELARLVVDVKGDIEEDFRAHEDDDEPGILLTVGSNGKGKWGYQTGDTSYTGGAYGFRHWGSCGVHADTNPREAAEQILDELRESFWNAA